MGTMRPRLHYNLFSITFKWNQKWSNALFAICTSMSTATLECFCSHTPSCSPFWNIRAHSSESKTCGLSSGSVNVRHPWGSGEVGGLVQGPNSPWVTASGFEQVTFRSHVQTPDQGCFNTFILITPADAQGSLLKAVLSCLNSQIEK